MHTKSVNIKIYKIAPLVWTIAFFLLFSGQAGASIVVDGSREFRDGVNECLNTYRNAPGIVGDVIRELEKSDNEHRIPVGTTRSPSQVVPAQALLLV